MNGRPVAIAWGLLATVGFALHPACSRRSSSDRSHATAATSAGEAPGDAGSATAATRSTDAGSAAPSNLPDPRIAASRAWLERWLRAQNQGSFADYSALYAAGFHGVRRTGSEVVSLDRQGWLADRQKMFRHSMQVTADDVSVTPRADAVEVRFIQIWKSGSYADAGEKVLQLEGPADQLVASSEDLLFSRPLAKAPPSQPERPAIYAVARFDAVNKQPLLVVPRHWRETGVLLASATPVAVVAGGEVTAVRRKLHADTAPEDLKNIVGAPLVMANAEGKKVCEAKAAELHLAVSVHAPKKQEDDLYRLDRQQWRELSTAGAGDELGWAVWKRVTTARPAVIATVEASGDCSGAVWAYPGGAAAPKVVAPTENKKVDAAVLAAFRTGERYEEWGAKYELETPPDSRADWMAELEDSLELTAFRGPAGTTVFASTLTGPDLYVLDDAGAVLYAEDTASCGEPTAGLDLDGGNRLTLLLVSDFDAGCLIFPSGWSAGLGI